MAIIPWNKHQLAMIEYYERFGHPPHQMRDGAKLRGKRTRQLVKEALKTGEPVLEWIDIDLRTKMGLQTKGH